MAKSVVKFYSSTDEAYGFPDWESESSDVYLNPRFDAKLREKILRDLHKVGVPKSSIVVLSSGTAGQPKVYLFSKSAFLNSALRLKKYFNLSSDNRWLCSLPLFHVGALAISARAHVTGARTFVFNFSKWNPAHFYQQLSSLKITHSSLVPTQLFDVLALNRKAPPHLELLLLGGEKLNLELKNRARLEGLWPIQASYGMTEAASTLAVEVAEDAQKNLSKMQWLDGVKVASTQSGELEVFCDSLYSAQLKNFSWLYRKPEQGHFLNDEIEILDDGGFFVVGRKNELIKVRGEFVHLKDFEKRLGDFYKVAPSLFKFRVAEDSRPVLEIDFSVAKLKDFLMSDILQHNLVPAYLKPKELRVVDLRAMTSAKWKA